MFEAGLPALGSIRSAFPKTQRSLSVACDSLIKWSHRADITTHYGGASAAAFHRTSLFTQMETNPRAPRTDKA